MFGFGCTDPLAGTAPGTHRGELCTTSWAASPVPTPSSRPDPSTVARLLQARDHLRAAATALHPARWQAFYAPQLRILEEDILPRFTARELAAAQPLMAQLPPLPDCDEAPPCVLLRTSNPSPNAQPVAVTHRLIAHGFCATRLGTMPYGFSSRPMHSKKPDPFECTGTSHSRAVAASPMTAYAPLLQSSRQLIALIRCRSLSTGLAQRASTVAGNFSCLRQLLRWMDQRRLLALCRSRRDGAACSFSAPHRAPGVRRATLAATTVQQYLYLLTYLYAFATISMTDCDRSLPRTQPR